MRIPVPRRVAAIVLAGAMPAAAEPARVSFSLHSDGGWTNWTVKWTAPVAERNAFRDAVSDEARAELGVAALKRQEAGGDRPSAFELGYLHLFGIGMTQNLAEAEARLRIGPGLGRPEGLHWMASYLSESRPGVSRDLPRAGALALAALEAGHKPAVSLGLWLAKLRERPALRWVARRLIDARLLPADLAERILRQAVKLEPGNADALMELADARMEARDHAEAWRLATRVLALPDVPAKTRAMARLIRVSTAQKAGRVAELGRDDVREIAAMLPRRAARIAGIVAAVIGMLLAAGLLALWAFLTRRRGARGPGWFLTGGWVGFHALIFGVGILHPAGAAITGLMLAVAILLAMHPAVRLRLFPPLRFASFAGAARPILGLAAGLALVFAFNLAYEQVYTRWTGRPPDLQLVAVFLRADTAADMILLLAGVAVFVPIVEETAFRGFLTDWLARRLRPWVAVLISAALFGVIHGFTAALPVAGIGLVCGWLRLRTGGLWLPVALHGLINGIAIFML